MATIKRGGKGVRRSVASTTRANNARRAKAKTSSLMDAVMSILPFTEEQLHRIFLVIILGGAAALAWFVASLAGVPAMAQQQIAGLASDAGFVVRRVTVTGVERMNDAKVYNSVLNRKNQPMPLVDLEEVRAELLKLSWVKDARVARQLPDTLLIDIVERKPHAVLAKPDRLVLIDETGAELEPISISKAKGMLEVSGPGAKMQVGQLGELLDAAPALKPKVAAAEWVGNRRWDLTFSTRQVLALPEGTAESAGALITFAKLDGGSRMLGGKVATFDMRAPGRIYMRVPGRAQEELKMDGGS